MHVITSTTIRNVFIFINTVIFLLLACLHFYWIFGGRLWFEDVLPTNSTGSNRMNPGKLSTIIVSVGLLTLALVTFGNIGKWDKQIDRKYFRFGAILISILFFARAIGDFKFIGFFKTITGTRFAINDSLYFSPICVLIAVISLLIFMSNKNQLKA